MSMFEYVISTLYKYAGNVSTVCGTSQGYADGSVEIAKFDCPRGVAVDSLSGDIFVADYANNRIRKISAGN